MICSENRIPLFGIMLSRDGIRRNLVHSAKATLCAELKAVKAARYPQRVRKKSAAMKKYFSRHGMLAQQRPSRDRRSQFRPQVMFVPRTREESRPPAGRH